jgi:hypothetical protein
MNQKNKAFKNQTKAKHAFTKAGKYKKKLKVNKQFLQESSSY